MARRVTDSIQQHHPSEARSRRLVLRQVDVTPVDCQRIAVAGLWAGASMAALLVTRYPERFKAVVMHVKHGAAVPQGSPAAMPMSRLAVARALGLALSFTLTLNLVACGRETAPCLLSRPRPRQLSDNRYRRGWYRRHRYKTHRYRMPRAPSASRMLQRVRRRRKTPLQR